jgi:periplasmic copper chaperone A
MSAASRARALTRTAIVGAAAAAGLALFAVPAFAHITVTPGSAQAGSAAVLTFHVPNEESKADTTGVDVQIPTGHPIAQLLVQPVPGWSISVKTITLAKPIVTDDGQFTQAVSEVIWSGGRIAPGQFQDFSLSADPLPQGVSSLTFKAIQTYSNGDVVRWIDVAQPGQPEPDHPAPVLTLTTGSAAVSAGAAAAPAATASPGSNGMALDIAIVGLVLGLIGIAFTSLSWRRNRRTAIRIEPAAPAPNGSGLGLAVASATRPAPQPQRPAAPARGAPSRKSGNNRRGSARR